MRFQRRITIVPGLRLNLSGSGVSLSAGPRGASVTIGRKGVYGNIGIPGTGLSHRSRLSGGGTDAGTGRRGSSRRGREAELLERFHACAPRLVAPLTGGPIELIDSDGNPLPQEVQDAAWKHLKSDLLEHLDRRCADVRTGIDALTTLHQETPAPEPPLAYREIPFAEVEPAPPVAKSYHWLARWFAAHRARVDTENAGRHTAYLEHRRAWEEGRDAHDRAEQVRRSLFAARDQGDTDAVFHILEVQLAALTWPQDTQVDLHLDSDGRRVFLDVDLPEIEDLPNRTPEIVARSRELRIRPFSDAAKRRLYASHIHAVAFRLLGEAFHACPGVETVIASAYSQRPDRATGAINDEYLLSVVVRRDAWNRIDFGNLAAVDPSESLAMFELRRRMTKTGVFTPIEPFA